MAKFEKGNRFSTGRAPGSRNKSTVWLDQLGNEGTEKVIGVVQDLAEKGDMRAASIVLARTWPHRRGRPVKIDLPKVETTSGLVQAHAAVVAAMAEGELTPDEAASVGALLETQRRAIETHDHELRIQELERKKAEKPSMWQSQT
jgi:hypothetical protein